MTELFRILGSVKLVYADWRFSDMRIDIPPMSHGSDASNPHTQYSNAVATFWQSGIMGVGASFTLGEGNQYLCQAADYMIAKLDGKYLDDLIDSPMGLAEVLINPVQLRWLSPNAGIPMMAAGLIMNTVLDYASKKANLPAWKFLASLDFEELMKLVSLKHLKSVPRLSNEIRTNRERLDSIDTRIAELEACGIPAYFTTWIGSSASELVDEIARVNSAKGITSFKVKIGSNIEEEQAKIETIVSKISNSFSLSVDANQKLNWQDAIQWMEFLSSYGVLWLEEPFAPDNILLFQDLVTKKSNMKWMTEIATGENCPNLQIAEALFVAGIDRFQADPCRMMGLSDACFSGFLSNNYGINYTPHAGGAGLDEMSPHLQFFYLTAVEPSKNIDFTLTEHIGFCSKYYLSPSVVRDGRIMPPREPGFLVGLVPSVNDKLIPYREGATWLEL